MEGTALWTSLAAIGAFIIGVGSVLVRLIDRIHSAEKKADNAMIKALGTEVQYSMLERDLTAHRVNVAENYVPRVTLQNLEVRILGAINDLGIRLDKRMADKE